MIEAGLPSLAPEIELEDELLLSFVLDMAQRIHRYSTIAERYGFGDEATLFQFLKDNEAIAKKIARYRVAFESDQAVPDRVRLKAGLAAEDLIHHIALRCKNADTPMSQAIDGFHKILRAAGTDGPPPQPRAGDFSGGATGTTFNLAIVFSNGETAKITATNLPTAVDLPVGEVSEVEP